MMTKAHLLIVGVPHVVQLGAPIVAADNCLVPVIIWLKPHPAENTPPCVAAPCTLSRCYCFCSRSYGFQYCSLLHDANRCRVVSFLITRGNPTSLVMTHGTAAGLSADKQTQ